MASGVSKKSRAGTSQGKRTAILLTVALVAGCSTASAWFTGKDEVIEEPEAVEASGVSHFLQNMHMLAAGSPGEQKKLFATIKKLATRSPTTTNRLSLALALATSGHAAADIGAGREMLRSLLNDSALLLGSEQQLAAIVLNEIESRQQLLGASAARESRSSQAAASERQRNTERLAASRAEIDQLTQKLLEAEEKLRAITSIERSIRERTDDDIEP